MTQKAPNDETADNLGAPPTPPVETQSAEPARDTGDEPVKATDPPEQTPPAELQEVPLEIEIEPPSAPVVAENPLALRVAELEKQLADSQAKQKDSHERHLRAVADLENFRKRSKRDVDDAKTDSQGKVLKEMLPVVDNLERAVQHAQSSTDVNSVLEGIKLILRQFVQAFERCNVKQVDAKGKTFDPNLHEAVSQTETDQFPPGTVVEVLQAGYRIGERLLRPALTVVSKAPEVTAITALPKAAPVAAEVSDDASKTKSAGDDTGETPTSEASARDLNRADTATDTPGPFGSHPVDGEASPVESANGEKKETNGEG